MEVKGFYS